MTRSNGAIWTRTLCESISDFTQLTSSADQLSDCSIRDERGVILPKRSASRTDRPKRWNGWIPWWLNDLLLLIQCIYGLFARDRMTIIFCTGLVVYIFFGSWIKKRLWPSCESRAIEEAVGEK